MKNPLILYLLMLLGLTMAHPGRAMASDDWQCWYSADVKHKFTPTFEARFENESRYGSRGTGYYYTHNDVGATWKVSDSFSLGACFRKISEKAGGKWGEEERPYLNATFRWKSGTVEFSDRNRLEYRFFKFGSGQNDHMRYRNSLKISFLPRENSGFKISPMVIDEVFYSLNSWEFNRNRLFLGIESRSKGPVNFEVTYLLQSTRVPRPDEWRDANAIVTRLHMQF